MIIIYEWIFPFIGIGYMEEVTGIFMNCFFLLLVGSKSTEIVLPNG